MLGAILLSGAALLPLQAQNKNIIDSLKHVLEKKNLPDTQRIDAMLELAWNYSFANADSGRSILYQCISLAARDNRYSKIGDAYAYMGTSHLRTDDYDSALFYYQKAESFYKKDTTEQAEINIAANRMSMGTTSLQKGDHQTALNHYLQAINPLERAGDYNNLATAYANIGLVYNDIKQYEKALDYHQKALEICINDSLKIPREKTSQIQMFLAIDHLNLKEYENAYKALQRSETMVTALHSDYLYTIFYGIRGRYFQELKRYRPSNENFEEALKFSVKSHQKFQQANALQQIGINQFELKDYRSSINYLLKSYPISQKIGDKVRERLTLQYLSKAYAELPDNKEAVKYYQRYVHLSDSLQGAETKQKINEIENKYQAKKKQDSILVLQKNYQLQELSAHKKETLNTAIMLGILLLLLVGLLYYRNLRNKHHILKQKEQLHAQRILELEKEQQLVAVQSIMKGQEEERSRLARDLHDGIGGLLSGVKLSLSTMKGNVFLSEGNAQAFNSVIGQLDQSISELRRVSHNMMPEALIKFGLKEALENYCENLNLSGELTVQFQAYGMDKRMEQSTEIILYRIVQELLNNIIKHADARTVLIQLIQKEDRFSLTVEDDGKGFDISRARNKGGAGLSNILARVDYLGATIDFRSSPGEGTSVNIEGGES